MDAKVSYSNYNHKSRHGPNEFLVDESDKKTSVVLPPEDYEELSEDIHDLTVIAERKNEPSISLEELKKS